MSIFKRLTRKLAAIIQADYERKHYLFTGRWPEEEE